MRVASSLRARLTLTFTLAAAALVIIAAVGSYRLLSVSLWGPLDAALQEEAETLAGIEGMHRRDELVQAVSLIGTEAKDGPWKFVRVYAADGSVIAASGKPQPAVAASRPPSVRAVVQQDVGTGRDISRLVWLPSKAGGWIVIGIGARRQVAVLLRAKRAIAVGSLAAIALLAALCWRITSRATAEIDRVAAELETLEAGSLDRRLAPRRTAEVDRLVEILNRLLERLEVAMSHLRRFSADAAHELRTPVAALRAHLEATLARAETTDDYRNGVLDGLEQIERLGRLAESLLTLNQLETGGPPFAPGDLVALDAVAREVASFMEPIAQEEHRAFTCRAENRVDVAGTAPLLKRLIVNLVDNAFRHTPPAAGIELIVRTSRQSPILEVLDHGPGIAAADLPHVFERFRRGRTRAEGAGLGLALCQEIVARHGAQIAIDSAPQAGTRVTVTFPPLIGPAPVG
jgi:signal transduction histidine kinase